MKIRDPYFDNLKFILILLVVLGHFFSINCWHPLLGALTNVIYSFHMPVFIFISGFFSKNINSPRKVEINYILFIYIVFEILNNIYKNITDLGTADSNLHFCYPTFQNWYLMGLFIWRILAPSFNLFNHRNILGVLVLLSLIIGFDDQLNNFLSLYRILYFMPFFILGYFCADFKVYLNKYLKYKTLFLSVFCFLTLGIFLLSYFSKSLNSAILYAFNPFNGYENSFYKFIIRFLGLFSSLVISICFLFVIPCKKTRYTRYGANTMNVFLLHMFMVYPLITLVKIQSNYYLLYLIFSSLLITYFLSSEFVNKCIQPFVNINFYLKK